MLFPTITFAIFLTLVLGAHTVLLGRPRAWKATMLAASYIFYAWWDWRFLTLIWLSTAVDFVAGRALRASASPTRRRLLLVLSLATNLGMLGFFKYADFFVESFVNLMADLGLAVSAQPLGIILPVGISFYTFQTMSYSIDIYRGRLEPTESLLDFALFVGFFPQLVAGPIVRARDFLAQLGTDDRTPIDTGRSLRLILGGLFKKIVIADVLATELVDGVFANPEGATGLETLLAIYGYALQIYGDFSGYSDIAIGIALLLGFRFSDNFDQPYRAASLQEFWRRWHISLSSWLRDYLYVPLGGNRSGQRRTYINLGIVMLLGGLWHGASWNFVIWGGIHGGMLALERTRGKASFYELFPKPFRVSATFLLVLVAWVFFRTSDLACAITHLQSMFGLTQSQAGVDLIAGLIYQPYHLLIMGIAVVVIWSCPQTWNWTKHLTPIKAGACLLLFWLSLAILATQAYNPFIYFIF